MLSLAKVGQPAEPAIPTLQELANNSSKPDSLRREAAAAIEIIRGNGEFPMSAYNTGSLLDD